jgi:hypothetical protein
MLRTQDSIPMHGPSERLPRGGDFVRGWACDSKYLNRNGLRSIAWGVQTSDAGVSLG